MNEEQGGQTALGRKVEMPPRHPNSKRFHQLLAEAGALHDRKQADYGRGDDPFANVRASGDWGVAGWVGAMIRLNDKVKRLQSMETKGYLVNESALDSFMDIAVYALIARVLYEQEIPDPDEVVYSPDTNINNPLNARRQWEAEEWDRIERGED